MLNQKSGDVTVPLERAAMDAYLAVPNKACRGSILMLQEIFGVTPAMRAIADDYAGEGYLVLVPDIFWRIERNLDLGNGEDPGGRDEAVKYSSRYDETLGTDDLVATAEWLRTAAGLPTKPAVMGFCLGGRMAVRVAARADVACMVSMYGVGLARLAPEISSTRCSMQLHFGDNDNHNPTAAIDEIRRLVASRERHDDEFFVYAGAEHAFYNRFRVDRFKLDAHQLARQRVLAFFEGHLRKQP